MKDKLLLHTCCAPCLIGTLPFLKNYDVSCLWYNPNIHPYTEYKSRLDALVNYTSENHINLIVRDDYGLVEFARSVIDRLDERCGYCYDSRLRIAAECAKTRGFELFSTTLLVSPYQNHEEIKKTGEKYAEETGVGFCYADFRGNFRAGQKSARENGVYMQKYCGCIFSEYERYRKDF